MTTTASYADFGETARQVLAGLAGTAQADDTPSPQPELNGLLLQLPGNANIYLVLNGYRCHVPDPQTFLNLFVPNATIIQDINIGIVPIGQPLSSGAVLAQGSATGVFLVTNGVRIGIPSADLFNRYQFNWAKVCAVPQIVIVSVPDGGNVEGPSNG